MSASPYGTAPGGQRPPPGPHNQPPDWPGAAQNQSPLPVIASPVVAAVGMGSWFRPASDRPVPAPVSASPQFSEQQIVDTKKVVRSVYTPTNRASAYSGSQRSDDAYLQFIIAVDNSLMDTAPGDCLITKLEQNQAASAAAARPVREPAMALQQTSLLQLANTSQEELSSVYDKLCAADTKVSGVSK